MKKIVLFFIILFFVFIDTFAQFVHPGIDQSQDDLNYMKHLVLSGDTDCVKAFELLKNETNLNYEFDVFPHILSGPFGNPDIGGKELSSSSRMAYNCAVLWYITGNDEYAKKAITIIEKWALVLRSFNENNAKLLVALTGYLFCNAAEILRYNYSGWTKKNTESISKMMMSVYYPTIRYYFSEANGNWDGAIMHTLMAIAVFMDNKQLFDNTLDHYLHGKCNGSIIKYIYPNGQCQETQRDQGHVQMGLYEFSAVAQIAYNQGIDLFGVAENRLALGLEYTSSFVNGNKVYAYGKPSERFRYNYYPNFEFCLKYYQSKGFSMPNLTELCNKIKLENTVSALFKLTSQKYEFSIGKVSNLKELRPSNIAYPTGALIKSQSRKKDEFLIVDNSYDLQSIINRNKGNYSKIYLKAGEYRLYSTLIIPSNMHICGDGRKTIILCDPSVCNAAIKIGEGAKNVIIENLILDGATSHDVGSDPNTGRFERTGRLKNRLSGILINGKNDSLVSNILLKNLTVINFSRFGVYISDSKDVDIESCDITENGSHVIPGPKLHHNILMQNVENINVCNTRMDNSLKGSGIVFNNCNHFIVDSCEIARNAWHGIMFSESYNGIISNCLIEGNDGCGIMGEFLNNGSKNISVNHNKIQCNNSFGLKSFTVLNLQTKGNIYSYNGNDSIQEYISSDRILQTDELR